MPEDRQQVDQQDPGVLRAVAEHELGPVGEAAPFQGAVVVAMGRRHGRKVRRQVVLDAPAEVTGGKDQRLEEAAESRENRGVAAARRSRGHAEEAERIAPQVAVDGEVAVAPEELRSAEALTVAGRLPGLAGTAQAREHRAEAVLAFVHAQAEEGPAPARFRDAEVGEPKLGIDHAPSSSDQTPPVPAPHSGRAR